MRDSAITFAGSLARLGLSLVVARLLARELGPESLGAFYVVSAAVLILGTVGDGGLSYTAVRRVAGLRASAPEELPAAIAAFLVLKLAFAGVLTLLVLALAEPIAGISLRLTDGPLLLRIAVLGLVTTALSGWASFVAQGLRRFGWVAVAQTGMALAGLTGFAILQATGAFTVANAVWVGVFTPLVSFALLAPVFVHQPVRFASLRQQAIALLGFSRWLWVSAILSITTAQLDLLLVNRWAAPAQVGFYGLAGRLALAADLINQSNFIALLPAVSAQRTAAQHRAFMAASLRRTVPLAGLLLIGAWLAGQPIVWTFGAEYAPAVPLFWILMLGVAFDLVTTPLILVAFPLNMPRTLAASDFVRVVTLAGVAALLVPGLGPAGAAWAKLAAKVLGVAFTLAFVLRRMRD